MTSLAIIPARSGSKGIPNKNIIDFMGFPLIYHTINSVLECGLFDKVIVSTDSEEIASTAKSFGAEVPFLRPSELAMDSSGALEVIRNVIENLKESPGVIGYFQPTSPLRTSANISEAMNLFLETKNADSLVSVIKTPHNMIPESQMKRGKDGFLEDYLTNESKVLLRQNKPSYFSRNGAAIYLLKAELLNTLEKSIIGGNIIGYEMDKWHSIDIDTEEDLQVAKLYAEYLETKGFKSEK